MSITYSNVDVAEHMGPAHFLSHDIIHLMLGKIARHEGIVARVTKASRGEVSTTFCDTTSKTETRTHNPSLLT